MNKKKYNNNNKKKRLIPWPMVMLPGLKISISMILNIPCDDKDPPRTVDLP